ncbi:hypothetical protein [Polaromonas sp. YR568]|uniref:hypothetical protein n=1 Tax=Polaromonas sp. YR568 TaxID=1855301 RepID=UPI0031376FB3
MTAIGLLVFSAKEYPKLAKEIKAFLFYDLRAKAAENVRDARGGATEKRRMLQLIDAYIERGQLRSKVQGRST